MNLRALVAVVYVLVFGVTFVNMIALPVSVIVENAATLFSGAIVALMGVLIALLVYEDGEDIKVLLSKIEKLEAGAKKTAERKH